MIVRSSLNGKVAANFAVATFSALRIALALGKSKRAVQLALHGSAPARRLLVKGQQADAWRIDQLPIRFLDELQAAAALQGYRDAEHLLNDPPRRWGPKDKRGAIIPLSEIAVNQIERASRLQAALATSIQLRNELGDAASRAIALRAFRRHYGPSSDRNWRRLLKRTIQRDAGEQRFDDLSIYLDEIVRRKAEAREVIVIGKTAADRTVLDALSAVRNPSRPTLEESALIWTIGCEFISDLVDRRATTEKRAQRRLFKLLVASHVSLARTDDALRRLVPRKFRKWDRGGRTLAALQDQRPANSGRRAPQISEDDRLKLIGQAVIKCGGRISQAYRDLRQAGQLSSDVLTTFIDNPTSKSYVPRRIRETITSDVNRLADYHRGPRRHKLNGPYHTRDWSGVAAGDWMQADDVTPPVYFFKQGAIRPEITRGQFLPMIDERTTMILGFVLIQERNYNSLSIRALITEVCSEHGLPRIGFSFERGIWKSARILTGDRNAVVADAADTGLRRLGLRFRHADLPRGKVIERTIGQLQDLMESFPGYCGRNEMLERHERFQRIKLAVDAGRENAQDHFLSAQDLRERFAEIVSIYNDTPQQGSKLCGLSPRQGWEQLQGSPRPRFHAATHYFLASDVRKLKIGRNGVTVTIGKRRFNYKDEETGKRQGETVYAWFNAQRPESLPCTANLSGDELFVVERSYDLPAVGASQELLASEDRKAASHRAYAADLYHTVKNILPASAFRGQLLDRKGLRLGESIETQRKQITERNKVAQQLDRAVAAKAKRAGLSPVVVHRSQEAVAAMGRLAELEAEIEAGIHDGESLQSEIGGYGGNGVVASTIGNSQHGTGKTYVLDAPKDPLTSKQRNGIYWRLWKAAETAQPGSQSLCLNESRARECEEDRGHDR
jgi:hypothetical protein